MGVTFRAGTRIASIVAFVSLSGAASVVHAHAPRTHAQTDRSLTREDSFRSAIPDGSLDGTVDFTQVHYVPARGQSGYLVVIPARDDFDSVRINLRVSQAGRLVGTLRGGIVYWRQGRPVIAFSSIEGHGGQIIPVRGYFEVAALVPNRGARPNFKPGENLLLVRGVAIRLSLVIDHTEIPPSDTEDDD